MILAGSAGVFMSVHEDAINDLMAAVASTARAGL
jgi:hypothetical protein